MSRFSDKVKSLFTVDYDEYEDDYYDEYDDEIEEEIIPEKQVIRPKRERQPVVKEEVQEKPVRPTRAPRATQTSSRSFRNTRNNKVVPLRSGEMEVCVIKPSYYENTRDIIDTLLEGKSVVLNLEGIKLELAQRIVDSVSGGCYAIQGNLQKISGYIYLVTPSSVDITGDFQDFVSDASDYSKPSYTSPRRSY